MKVFALIVRDEIWFARDDDPRTWFKIIFPDKIWFYEGLAYSFERSVNDNKELLNIQFEAVDESDILTQIKNNFMEMWL